MKTIKITSVNGQSIISSLEGEQILLPEDGGAINDFQFQKVENNVRYFIEVSPDKNFPINFGGIKIAMQIYFNHLNNNMMQFEIVLFGFDSKESLFWHSIYSYFLKCSNVYYKQIEFNTKWIYPNNIKTIDKKEAIEVLKNIGIKPPTSYKSHHSITNEWSIFRWSSYLGIPTSLEKEVENSLYFQYLKAIYEIDPIDSIKYFLVGKGKILLIDDEEQKGWDAFFKRFKLPDDKNLKIKSIGREFKHLENKDLVIDQAIQEIKAFNPDVIILDLRLHDSDFDEHKPEELTGYSILEKIKNEINNGIQVILFSASNKIWNYQALAQIGFDGWILKESPELSVDPQYTQNAVKDLKALIDHCLERGYLKTIFKDIQELSIALGKKSYESNFLEMLKKQLKLSYYLLSKAENNEQFAYAYVSLYMVIEMINKEFESEIVEECYRDKETNTYKFKPIERLTEWNKIAYLYFKKWMGTNNKFIRDVSFLITKRNGFVHNDRRILDKPTINKHGETVFLNHDIYKPEGFINLFGYIKKILNLL